MFVVMIFSGLETEYLVLCGIATTLLMLRSRLKNRLALKDAADILTVSVSSGSVLQALNNIFFSCRCTTVLVPYLV